MAIKAIGFDIDGTLYPVHRAWFHSISHYFTYRKYISAFSRTRKIMRYTGKDYESDEISLFAREINSSIAIAKDIRDNVIYKDWEKCFCKVKVYRGVSDTLHALKSAGLKVGVLSDFPVGRKLEYFGLHETFDTVLGYPDSGRLKPSPEPFYRMAEQLEVEPSEILYIGNKLSVDLAGAENAGLRGALVGKWKRFLPPDVTVYRNYKQMKNMLLREVNYGI